MDTSTFIFAILTICLVGITFHAWRLGRCGIGCHDRPVADGLDLGQRVDPGMCLRLNGTDR
jgi:hypothetical protein